VIQPVTGESAILAPGAGDAVMAAGVFASQTDSAVAALRPGYCTIGDGVVGLLVARGRQFAPDVQREARRRAEELASDDRLPTGEVRFLVAGTVLGKLDDAADVLAGEDDPADLVDGPGATRITYLLASSLLAEAA
jgi:hypothetical protein